MPKQSAIPTPRFNLKAHSSNTEDTLIVMVYRYQIPSTEKKVRLVYSTGEKVQPRYWKKKAYKAIVPKNHKEYSKMNDRLSDLAKLAKAIYEDYDYGEISVSDFKDELDYRSERKKRPVPEVEETHKPFMRFIDDYIEERINKENSKRGTWKMFRTTANHLKKYAKDKGKVLDYEDFDYNFLNDFENWLYKAPRRHSTNYASKVLSVVRQFLHAATRAGYNQNMTFSQRGYSIDKIKIRKEVLSFDELRTLYDLDLSKNPRLNRVRDLFLIGAYSGLRFSDFTRIRPDHIIVEDGIEMIHIFTQKTDTEVYIPLLPELRSILRRNGNSSPKTISNQKMNVYLKELFEYAGFDEDVMVKKSVGGKIVEEVVKKWELAQSHMARRSFATNFYTELGIPASQLMMITGHSTESQFFKYINRDGKDNAKKMAKLMREKISHLKVV